MESEGSHPPSSSPYRMISSMAFDPAIQRKIMGQFATGVTVVTTGGPAGSHGLTANAVASLSLDPPLVLVAVEKKTHSLEYLKVNRCFAVNILRLDQEDISRRFAKPGPKDFTGLSIQTKVTGARSWPIAWLMSIAGCLKSFPVETTRSLSARLSLENCKAASRFCTMRASIAGLPIERGLRVRSAPPQ